MTAPKRSEGERRGVVLGSRGSALALAQARWVSSALAAAAPDLELEIRIIRTTGDRFADASLASGSTVGFFVREIEEELLARRIDLAVHSLKDLPTAQPAGLGVVAVPLREDPGDVLVVREGGGLEDLPEGAVVGTGSPRRIGQIRALRPDLRFEAIRGNVDTRLRKLQQRRVDALVLAAAGLRRLGIADGAVFHPFPIEQVLPAPGQGALGVETRDPDGDLPGLVRSRLNDPTSEGAVIAERALLKALGGGCQMPVGALGVVEAGRLRLRGVVAARDGSKILRDEILGPLEDPSGAGRTLGKRLLEAGAAELLAEVRRGEAER
jgi:hydroxymethylbilane synthase